MSVPLPFAVATDNVSSKSASSQRLVNMYAEPNPKDSKYPFTLYNTPGLLPLLTLGDGSGNINGMHVVDNILYVVSGANVYSITTNYVVTLLGNIGTQSSRVYMEDNGFQVSILKFDGTQFVVTIATGIITQVLDPAYQLSASMTSIDGFGVFAVINSTEIFISNLLDFTTYNALNFTNATTKTDYIVRPFNFNDGLWVFKQTSYQIYANIGAQYFPFQNISGTANTSRGLAAPFAVAQEGASFNDIYWLGEDRIVYKAQGYNPQKVSTYGIENDIAALTVVNDAFMFVYTQLGHKFLVLTFPTEMVTFVYDMTADLWHERQSFGFGRWIPNAYAFFNGLQIVGHYSAGKLYTLDTNTYTDDGATIQRWIYTQPTYNDDDRIVYDKVQLDIDGGVGLTTGQGSDPQVMMQYSDDGGETWCNEKWRGIGKIGEYFKRVIWRKMGGSRQRIFRFLISDPIPCKINGLYADLRKYRA